jgi:hypothetical protein
MLMAPLLSATTAAAAEIAPWWAIFARSRFVDDQVASVDIFAI